MPLIQPKQIQKVIAAPVKIIGATINRASQSTTVNSIINAVLSTANNSGGSVPLQVSTSVFVQGVVVSSPINKTEIFDNASKNPIEDGAGNELYGRITFGSNNYTLRLYSLIAGTETLYVPPNTIVIDFDFTYRFTFDNLPADALISSIARNVMLDPKGQGANQIIEKLTVTSTNTLSGLSDIPSAATKTILAVNGKEEFCIGSSPAFSVSGATIIWNAGNALYSLDTNDVVYVKYFL